MYCAAGIWPARIPGGHLQWLRDSMQWLAERHRQHEWMDEPTIDASELRRALAFIRRVNVAFGYTRSIIAHIERFSHSWRPGERIDILDLATGSADIPLAIIRWGRRRGFDIHVVGIDRHPVTARAAAEADEPRLRIVQADVFAPPFADQSFDYALTAMFLHHLADEQIVAVLRTMDRLARRGIIVADLLRHRRAYAWIRLLTVLSSPMIRHDAAASVAQSLTKCEAIDLRRRAGISYAQYHRHFGHRFVLAGERGSRP